MVTTRAETARQRVIGTADKSFPPEAAGHTVADFVASGVTLAAVRTPLFVLDEAALSNNLRVMAEWVGSRGFELMPHGKTTMAPALWRRQLEAGATGITVATPWQARVALLEGVPFVHLANGCIDPTGLAAIVRHLRTHPEARFVCWVDSVAAVDAMERVLGAVDAEVRIAVLVEAGDIGGRMGTRSVADGEAVARRVHESDRLELRGVAGYEGVLGHDRSDASIARVRRYLSDLVELSERIEPLIDAGRPIISVGGSAYFDLVADVLADVAGARIVLRSGSYLAHDSGFYGSISPLDGAYASGDGGAASGDRLVPAMWTLARVLSRPEPTLALLDAGKRDVPFDEGLPVPVAVRDTLNGPERELTGASITGLNDQHAYLSIDADTDLPVGSVVRLGLSHPCTAFDKWRLIPVVDSASGVVVEVVETFF